VEGHRGAGLDRAAECVEVRVTMTDNERMLYAVAEPDERYKLCSTVHSKIAVVKSILERHPGDQTLVIGAYLDQLDELGEELNAPVIQGSTKTAEREALFDAFRRGEVPTLVVSKVANFSIDLPEANVAVQVSGTFGSRQEEAQRLGRLLRPKADGGGAIFYSVVSATAWTPNTPRTGSASSQSRATATSSRTPTTCSALPSSS
jgi:DNA excision repair protein ERCC-3